MNTTTSTKTGTYFYNGKTYNFKFATTLHIADKVKFVDSVIGLVVDENHYNSIIRDLIFDFYLIDIMTDIETDNFKESDSFLIDIEEFLSSTNIVKIVKANMSSTLLDELNIAVDKSIEYITGIHPSPISDALASLLFTLEKKVNEIDLDSMAGMAQKFVGMTEDFTLENIVSTYMNSDIHKKNLAEIAVAKNQRTEFVKDIDRVIKLASKENE